jgi:hypothetical protein
LVAIGPVVSEEKIVQILENSGRYWDSSIYQYLYHNCRYWTILVKYWYYQYCVPVL